MFSGFNLKDSNLNNIKFTLMKNMNEEYGEIPKIYVKNMNFKFQDCSTITIEIPNKIFEKGSVINERLYNLILGKQQQIIVDNGGVKERFIITQCDRSEEVYKGENGKDVIYRVKKLECKSYEYSLIDKPMIAGEDLYRQLYYDPTITEGAIDISEGYLNMLENDTDFTVEVTELAKKEFGKAYNEYYVDISDSNILNMAKGTTIWEKDVTINPIGENVVNLKVSYTSIKTYDDTDKLLIDSKKVHDTNLNGIYTGIKHIKAVYDGNETYRYGIHYIITLVNNEIVDRWEDLNLFLNNQRVAFTGIILAYADGSEGIISTIKHRVVTTGSYSYLSLLREDISNGFNVIVTFDTYNMKVFVCDRTEIGVNKGIEFSYSNYIQGINKKEQYDSICNKLNVSSSKTSIVDVNPFGTEYILDYSYHFDKGLMSEELMSSYTRYLANIENEQANLYDLRISKNTLNKKQIQNEAERTELDLNIRDLGVRRVDYIKENKNGSFDSELTIITTKINTKQTRFGVLMTDIQSIKDSIATIDEQIKSILKDISLVGATDNLGLIFNSELIKELNSITIEDSLEDDFYTVSLGLYNYAKENLTKRNKMGIEFDITTNGLLQNISIPHGISWNYYINVGDFVTLNDEEILAEDERGLRIIEFDFNPNEFDISKITFSNKDKKDEELKTASNIGKSINKSNSYINNYKTTWENSVNANDYMNSMLNGNGMDLKATAIRSKSQRVKYDQTEAGIYIIDGENEDKQIYLGASMICFTPDRWLTAKTSIDETGVIADTIVGKLILGKQLFITTELNEFYIGNINSDKEPDNNGNNFGIQIKENNIERVFLGIEKDLDGIRRARLRLTSKDGNKVVLDENGYQASLIFPFTENLDANYPIVFPVKLDENVSAIRKATLTITLENFRTYSRSVESAPSLTSSDGGGFSTTSGGGGGQVQSSSYQDDHDHMILGCVNPTPQVLNDLKYAIFEDLAGRQIYLPVVDAGIQATNLYTKKLSGGHNHTLTLYNHYHSVSIGNHFHVTPPHSHPIEHGIYESTRASGVSVYVNGSLVENGISGSGSHEINITNHLRPNFNNIVTITSSTLGRVSSSIYCSYWNIW